MHMENANVRCQRKLTANSMRNGRIVVGQFVLIRFREAHSLISEAFQVQEVELVHMNHNFLVTFYPNCDWLLSGSCRRERTNTKRIECLLQQLKVWALCFSTGKTGVITNIVPTCSLLLSNRKLFPFFKLQIMNQIIGYRYVLEIKNRILIRI